MLDREKNDIFKSTQVILEPKSKEATKEPCSYLKSVEHRFNNAQASFENGMLQTFFCNILFRLFTFKEFSLEPKPWQKQVKAQNHKK